MVLEALRACREKNSTEFLEAILILVCNYFVDIEKKVLCRKYTGGLVYKLV